MILRRLADAITEQNWFTVVLEVMIVVVGIFIGLQVDDWNDARKDRIEEARFLTEIQSEIVMELETLEGRLLAANHRFDSLANVILVIQSDDADAKLEDDQCQAALLSHTISHMIGIYGLLTYATLSDSGKLGIISDRELRSALSAFERQADFRAGRARMISQDVANITDNHAEIFPRTLTSGQQISRAACQLEAIRNSPTVRNKLQSNLGRLSVIIAMSGRHIGELKTLLEKVENAKD